MGILRSFLRDVSPKRAVGDFAKQWQHPTPHRWQILGVAMAATFAIFYSFIPADQAADPERPEVEYIEFFEPNRTDEQIVASNIENQQLQDEREALEEERAELRRSFYRELGRATGMDVDRIEREFAEEEAAADAKEAALVERRREATERALLDGQ